MKREVDETQSDPDQPHQSFPACPPTPAAPPGPLRGRGGRPSVRPNGSALKVRRAALTDDSSVMGRRELNEREWGHDPREVNSKKHVPQQNYFNILTTPHAFRIKVSLSSTSAKLFK